MQRLQKIFPESTERSNSIKQAAFSWKYGIVLTLPLIPTFTCREIAYRGFDRLGKTSAEKKVIKDAQHMGTA